MALDKTIDGKSELHRCVSKPLQLLQIALRYLDLGSEKAKEAENHIGGGLMDEHFSLNATEIALNDLHPVAHGQREVIEADGIRREIHHKLEIGHLLVRHYQHAVRTEVAYVEETGTVLVSQVASQFFGGIDEQEVADNRHHHLLAAVFQLTDFGLHRQIDVKIQALLFLQLQQVVALGEFLLVACASCKPRLLIIRHLPLIIDLDKVTSGYASRLNETFVSSPKPLLHCANIRLSVEYQKNFYS